MSPPEPIVPDEVQRRLRLAPVRALGGRANQHWLVARGGEPMVLRMYATTPRASVEYELAVLRRLHAMGVAVPRPVDEVVELDGRCWGLFAWLPGAPRAADDRRARGRLLAELHERTATLIDLGQRPGWSTAADVVRDRAIHDALRDYERLNPEVGRLLRWHLDQCVAMFDRLPLGDAETIVLHRDFAPWNLLFDGDRLAGILDFELTHLNYRASDFALAWRGYQDEVIDGYEDVRPLSDLDRALLLPTFWSWLFLGVADEVARMRSGAIAPHGFEWPAKQLLKRPARCAAPAYVSR